MRLGKSNSSSLAPMQQRFLFKIRCALVLILIVALVVQIGLPSIVGARKSGQTASHGGEEITNFFSEARVQEKTNTLVVTEVIEFISAGDLIKHGIVRGLKKFDIANGKEKVELAYRIISASELDSKSPGKAIEIPAQIRGEKGVMALYLGDPNKPLRQGTHTFTVQYEVSGKVRLDGTSELLNWDVTGTWPIPVKNVGAKIFLPEFIDLEKNTASVELKQNQPSERWWGGRDLNAKSLPAKVERDKSEKNSLHEFKPIAYLASSNAIERTSSTCPAFR